MNTPDNSRNKKSLLRILRSDFYFDFLGSSVNSFVNGPSVDCSRNPAGRGTPRNAERVFLRAWGDFPPLAAELPLPSALLRCPTLGQSPTVTCPLR